jgi:1-deoxy-D-xylulose-5-phosphate synthase
VFADELVNMARENERTVAVTAAMGKGTGLSYFGEQFPKRYFDVGIAEEHALTFCAGLAAAGMNPYVAIYSTFLQRGYDNIIHDIALQNLPVRIMIDRAGLAVSDGATHHGIFDVAFLSHIPSITLFAPVTYGTLCEAMHVCDSINGPTAIRYANSPQIAAIKEKFYKDEDYSRIGVVSDYNVDDMPKAVFVTYGNITAKVIEAQAMLAQKGISTGIVLVEKLRPYSDSIDSLYPFIKNADVLLFVEEGIKIGGYSMTASSMLREKYAEFGNKRIEIAAIDDNFASPTEKCDIYDYVGLSSDAIYKKMLEMIG